MAATDPVRAIRDQDLTEADPTPGMRRQVAFTAPGLWSGLVHTEPGAISGWHHHGSHQTSLFVVTGILQLESGPDGDVITQAGPGEFLHVPAGAVHRESNPGAGRSTAVIARSGHGAPTVNVAGPAGAADAPTAAATRARRYRPLDVQPGDLATYVEHDRTPDLSVGTYAIPAGGPDPQSPHTEDEVYVVVDGSATLWTPDAELAAEPGDVLVVPAGVEHRFVGVRPGFRVVVTFGPAEGSRAAGS
jgi:mannose-6-phosphate isomerase-like protein (cupin superfamily)